MLAWLRRKLLIRSAQRKLRDDMSARRITSDEWNALAYRPLKEAMKRIREDEIKRRKL